MISMAMLHFEQGGFGGQGGGGFGGGADFGDIFGDDVWRYFWWWSPSTTRSAWF